MRFQIVMRPYLKLKISENVWLLSRIRQPIEREVTQKYSFGQDISLKQDINDISLKQDINDLNSHNRSCVYRVCMQNGYQDMCV